MNNEMEMESQATYVFLVELRCFLVQSPANHTGPSQDKQTLF